MITQAEINKLERAFKQYWTDGTSEISDTEFDRLIEELRQTDPVHHLLNDLGLNTPRGEAYVHTTPMLSLNKVYTAENLKKWIDGVSRTGKEKFIVQLKYDGIAGIYRQGKLATRGNGHVGEDISRKIANVNLVCGNKSASLVKQSNISRAVVGELIIKNSEFNHLNETVFCYKYKNPRNFMSGFMNSKDNLSTSVKVDFIEYDQAPAYEFESSNFTVEYWNEVICKTMEEIKKSFDYPTDGLVIKLVDKQYAESLGYTVHHPNGAIAFKFAAKHGESEIERIDWQLNKSKLTPVAILKDEIDFGGAVVKKVTLHNYKFVVENSIKIGDTVVVERAGEIIPHVVDVIDNNQSLFSIPEVCPVCGGKLVKSGANLCCSNPLCKGTIKMSIQNSLDKFEIDGLGPAIIDALIKLELIKNPADIFFLTKKDLISIPRFGEKSADNLIKAIAESLKQKITPAKIMAAMPGLTGVGESSFKKIFDAIFVPNNPTKWKTVNYLTSVNGIGKSAARAIINSVKNNTEYLNKMNQLTKALW